MPRIKLSAPWDVFYREVNELFKQDDGIQVVYDEETKEIKLYVKSSSQASALNELLPTEMTYGNVTQKITVTPANGFLFKSGKSANRFRDAFEGNPIISRIETVGDVFTNPITYVAFVNCVVQYFNDDLGDINGQCSTLYQEIAKNVFGNVDGIYFCTDKPKDNYRLSVDTNGGWSISG